MNIEQLDENIAKKSDKFIEDFLAIVTEWADGLKVDLEAAIEAGVPEHLIKSSMEHQMKKIAASEKMMSDKVEEIFK